MTTRSRLASSVRVLLGGPPDEPLPFGVPEHLIFEVLLDTETGMHLDENLSDTNRRITSKAVHLQPDKYDFAVNASTLSIPAFAQLLASPTDTWRHPVEIVNLGSIDQAGIDGRLAVAFYGTPLRAKLSWIPQVGENQELTVWYDKSVEMDGTRDTEPAIEDAYTVHLKYQAVAQIIDIRNRARVEAELPIMPLDESLKMRIARGEQQWKKYVNKSGQMGLVDKPSSHPRAGQRHYTSFQRPGGGPL